MEPAFNDVKNLGKDVICVSILSYGMDDLIAQKYGIEVRTLFDFDELLDCLELKKRNTLKKYIQGYKENLKSVIL